MADVVLTGFDELQDAFKAISAVPFSVTRRALDGMAEVAEEKIRATGESMGVRDPDPDVQEHILDRISHSKPKQTEDGGKAFITFLGSRLRGNTVTRNAGIAYINEYGAPRRGISARPFISTGMTKNDKEISAPAEEIIGGWIEKTFSK